MKIDLVKYGKKLFYETFNETFISEISINDLTNKEKEKILIGYFSENINDFNIINSEEKTKQEFFKELIKNNNNYLLLDNYLIRINNKNIKTELEYIITKKYYKKNEILKLFFKYYPELFCRNNFGQSLCERYLLFNQPEEEIIHFFLEFIDHNDLHKILNNKIINKKIDKQLKIKLQNIYYKILESYILKKHMLNEIFHEAIVHEFFL